MTERNSIFQFTHAALENEIQHMGAERFRADQIFDWVYRKGVSSASEMSNIPQNLRDQLLSNYDFSLPSIEERLEASDETIKYRVGYRDGKSVECVMMPDIKSASQGAGVSLCISSQAGCALKCSFCATGTMGLLRNLTTAEIVSQIVLSLRDLPYSPTTVNVLFMGMGEPLLNLENVLSSLSIMNDENGLGIPMRRITVSTAGIPKGIQALFDLPRPPRLALSLHAPNQELRQALMPISKKYTLSELMSICRSLPLSAREKVTMEYILIEGQNDSSKHAKELGSLLKGMKVKVNLIPHNSWEGGEYKEPDEETIDAFMLNLKAADITATVRRSRGRTAAAACGQLAIKKRPPEREQ